jgi:hypothetical protein
MAEIILDNTKISVPKRLGILSFLSEIQKKCKQYIYVINGKEICVLQSLDQIQRGMWKRYKLPDIYGYYYIEPETSNEIILFSEQFANKLGSFPYEATEEDLYQKKSNAPWRSTASDSVAASATRPVSVNYSEKFIERMSGRSSNQSAIVDQTVLQPPIVPVPIVAPAQPRSGFVPNNYRIENNNTETSTQYISPKSLDNLNRILNYQKQNFDSQNNFQGLNINQFQPNQLLQNQQSQLQNQFQQSQFQPNQLQNQSQHFQNQFQPNQLLQNQFQPNQLQNQQSQLQNQFQPNQLLQNQFQPNQLLQNQFQPNQLMTNQVSIGNQQMPSNHQQPVYQTIIQPKLNTIDNIYKTIPSQAQNLEPQRTIQPSSINENEKRNLRYFSPPKKTTSKTAKPNNVGFQNTAPQQVQTQFIA